MAMLFSFTVRVCNGPLRRQVFWTEYEDRLHDVFVVVLEAIIEGRIRQPENLLGFIATVARRSAFSHIREQVAARDKHVTQPVEELEVPDSGTSPELAALHSEDHNDMLRRLALLKPLDREILSRFYLHGQDQPRICADLGITKNQFRVRKSRAKAKVASRCFGISRRQLLAAYADRKQRAA